MREREREWGGGRGGTRTNERGGGTNWQREGGQRRRLGREVG